MNTGRYELLKYTKKEIGSADSAMNYKRYYFSETTHYFLKDMEKVERIKKLDDNNILPYLPQSNTLSKWIKTNRIDFRKEKDVILFLNYYNATIPNKEWLGSCEKGNKIFQTTWSELIKFGSEKN